MADSEAVTRTGRVRYANQLIKLSELVATTDPIAAIDFVDCQIIGPALLTPSGCSFVDSSFEGDPQSLGVEVQDGTPVLAGSILAVDCTFTRCVFKRVSFAATSEFVQTLRTLPATNG